MVEVRVIKEEDDPICSRISMGGDPKIGYYLVYRGNLAQIKECFSECWKELKNREE